MKFSFTTLILFAFLSIFALLPGCATTTGNVVKDTRGKAINQALADAATVLGKETVNTLLLVAQQEASGGKANFQQASVQGLFSSVALVTTVSDIKGIITAFSGNQAPATAEAAATAFASSSAPSPAKVAAIASVISTATGAPPGK